MAEPTPTPALLDARLPSLGSLSGKPAQHAFLWGVASLATACGLYGLAALISVQSEREAGRAIVASQKGSSYLDGLTTALAAGHGRPYRH